MRVVCGMLSSDTRRDTHTHMHTQKQTQLPTGRYLYIYVCCNVCTQDAELVALLRGEGEVRLPSPIHIVSDANTLYIRSILRASGLSLEEQATLLRVHTNSAHWEGGDTASPTHQQEEEEGRWGEEKAQAAGVVVETAAGVEGVEGVAVEAEELQAGCLRVQGGVGVKCVTGVGCPSHLCKGAVLHSLLLGRGEEDALPRVLYYVGDGSNDWCPCVAACHLGLRVWVLCRRGFPLEERAQAWQLQAHDGVTPTMRVVSWQTPHELCAALCEAILQEESG